jgi:lipoate-protein ligase A
VRFAVIMEKYTRASDHAVPDMGGSLALVLGMRAPTVLAVFPAADGAVNFAQDEALMAIARSTGEELIRLYGWDRPTISFGRNERASGRFSPERIRDAGLDAIRRPTGGRALLHHREFTYAVAGPAAGGDTLRETYDRINTLISDALARMGVSAELAQRQSGVAPASGDVCFAAPSAGELTVRGRKLVASAQWREHGAFLQHGSVLVDNDQALLYQGMIAGTTPPGMQTPATLRELLGRAPGIDAFADALAASMCADGTPLRRVAPSSMLGGADIRARADHYRDPQWTWRR